MAFHDGMEFSTPDVDNTPGLTDCSARFNSGWWFAGCHANLNGLYLPEVHSKMWQGIIWIGITEGTRSLKATDMMYRPARAK